MSGHRVVHTDKAPAAIGPYSQALVHEKSGTVYVSGQLGMDPQSGQLIDTQDVEKQTVQALQNMNNILEAAGSHKSKVLKVNISLKSMNDFGKVNAIYEKCLHRIRFDFCCCFFFTFFCKQFLKDINQLVLV